MNNSHSPAFIAEMKEKLEAEAQRLEQELAALTHTRHGEAQADFPDYGRSEEDNAAEVADYQALAGTTVAIEERLKSVREALERVAAGTYGLTAQGEKIPENRLRANPAATTLVSL